MTDFLQQRIGEYNKEHCWQYQIRVENLEDDLLELKNLVDYKSLKTSDFVFRHIVDNKEKNNAINFIKRHEWLGTMTQYTTHYFGAYYKEILAGVITFSVPNSFSKLLGDNTKNIERLISRGACISWSPKNLASKFLMWCIEYMVHNTPYRLFTAYSDPTAKELGTIYQACNFFYLGQKSGTTTRYINPYTGKIVSDRFFRQKTAYKKYAIELGIEWQKDWIVDKKIVWDNMTNEISSALKDYSKLKQSQAEKIDFPSKHKYAYVLGVDKKETKQLRRDFLNRNKIFEYPKNR